MPICSIVQSISPSHPTVKSPLTDFSTLSQRESDDPFHRLHPNMRTPSSLTRTDDASLKGAPRADQLESIRTSLARRIRAAVRGVNGHRSVIRVSVPVPVPVDAAAFLRANGRAVATSSVPESSGDSAPLTKRTASTFWSGRGSDVSVAAVGVAEELSSHAPPIASEDLDAAVTTRLQDLPDGARYFGGMRFDASQPREHQRPASEWATFGTFRFVLPRFELVQEGGRTALACNLVGPGDVRELGRVLEALDTLQLPEPQALPALPSPTGRRDVPTRDAWVQTIKQVLSRIESGELEKIVMARRATLNHAGPLDPYAVLQHLAPATPNCFHFAFQYDDGPAFIGATPERLLARSGSRARSEAVAGTRSRASTEREDEVLREELMTSDKDQREHAYVEDAIHDTLSRYCDTVGPPDERTDMRLRGGRHIWSRVAGTLKPGVSTVSLLSALHPTPAVGGVPRERALDVIRSTEAFDRGWYAGPVGWIGRDDAEFAVAIRSGLVDGSRLSLYSGAGIVRGSKPTDEWDEIEQKIGNFLSLVD